MDSGGLPWQETGGGHDELRGITLGWTEQETVRRGEYMREGNTAGTKET